MIVEKKNIQPALPLFSPVSEEAIVPVGQKMLTVEEAYSLNPMIETYRAVKKILEGIHVNDDPGSPELFRTIKLDNGQLSRIKNNTHNLEYGIAFPAVFIHFIDVYYNIGQSRIGEGKGVVRIHYVLNTLNNSDNVVEEEGLRVYQQIVNAINEHKNEFPALVNRFQLKYWDMPLTFDDGVQPFWIDYEIWFNDYSGYRYKNHVEKYVVIPPFTNHSDQMPEANPENHPDHKDFTYEDSVTIKTFDSTVSYPRQDGVLVYNGTAMEPSWTGDMDKFDIINYSPATDAGDYAAVFALKAGYVWEDGSTGLKTIKWRILKAAQSFFVASSNIVCDRDGEEVIIPFSNGVGDGNMYVKVSDSSVIRARLEADHIAVKGIGLGEVSITIIKKETNNYMEASKTIPVAVSDVVYFGASESVPVDFIGAGKTYLPMDSTIDVRSELVDRKKCHWVAFRTSAGYHVDTIVDLNNEDITFELKSANVGDFTVYYFMSAMYISNTTKFSIRK